MKTMSVFAGLLLLAAAFAQQHEKAPNGSIYGHVIGPDGSPAKRVGLIATPLGVGLAARLPATKSNDVGEYRFENLPWWGKYSVTAEDEDAGYSLFSTGQARDDPPEVELTPEHRVAEMTAYLPPKAGFLHIHLTNQKTGADISAMRVALMEIESPTSPVFSTSCPSNHVILIPPDKSLLLHIWSDGFHEWQESIGKGKPILLPSGTRLTLDVQLEPVQ
jgi:hypothetical protein